MKHTQECIDYAVKTTLAGSGYHCIASCADHRRSVRSRLFDAQEKIASHDDAVTSLAGLQELRTIIVEMRQEHEN